MDAQVQAQLNAAIKKLRTYGPQMKRVIKQDLRTAAKPIVSGVKAAAPRRTGNLKRSIQVLPFRRSKAAVFVGPRVGKKGADGFYGRFIEFGTKKMAASPFIAPVADILLVPAQRTALELLTKRINQHTNAISI